MEPHNPLIIREAIPSDIPALLSLKCTLEPLDDQDDVNYADYYSFLLSHGIILVAEQGGSLVGFIAYENSGPICYIVDAGVVSTHLRHGIFSQLAKDLENNIIHHGYTSVLCHVKETNTLMMNLLEQKLHFKKRDRYFLFTRSVP